MKKFTIGQRVRINATNVPAKFGIIIESDTDFYVVKTYIGALLLGALLIDSI